MKHQHLGARAINGPKGVINTTVLVIGACCVLYAQSENHLWKVKTGGVIRQPSCGHIAVVELPAKHALEKAVDLTAPHTEGINSQVQRK